MPIASIDQERCDGCRACESSCPADVIRMNEKNKAYPAHMEDCSTCFLCAYLCPRFAIEVKPITTLRIFGRTYKAYKRK